MSYLVNDFAYTSISKPYKKHSIIRELFLSQLVLYLALMIKAILLDFDGTVVNRDILGVVSGLVGKQKDSEAIDKAFHQGKRPGLSGLIERVNLLKGVTIEQIEKTLNKEHYLMPGIDTLLDFASENNITIILSSGNITPILNYYKQLLGISYVIGSRPVIEDGIIHGISEDNFPDYDYKLSESKKILSELNIMPDETVAIGDSPGDTSKFLFAGRSIAINPKGGIEQYADYIIYDDLSRAIPLLRELNK